MYIIHTQYASAHTSVRFALSSLPNYNLRNNNKLTEITEIEEEAVDVYYS